MGRVLLYEPDPEADVVIILDEPNSQRYEMKFESLAQDSDQASNNQSSSPSVIAQDRRRHRSSQDSGKLKSPTSLFDNFRSRSRVGEEIRRSGVGITRKGMGRRSVPHQMGN